MIDKGLNAINCGNINLTVVQLNKTMNELEIAAFYNVNSFGTFSPLSLKQEVCRAEKESQKLISTISGYMAPLGDFNKIEINKIRIINYLFVESVIGVLIVLIGGYWSDISGRRKALILYPIVGQLLTQIG